MRVVEYGPGGFDPSKPDGNVIAEEEVELPARVVNLEQLHGAARTALTSNRAFLANASPTNAQTLAHVKALTRQVNALIRLELLDLDGTD